MTDLMQHLYEYILESRLPGLIDHAYYAREKRRAEELWDQLLAALPETQRHLLADYQNIMDDLNGLESTALFQTTFLLIRELR